MEKSISKISKSRQESGTSDIARVLKVGLGLTMNFRSAETNKQSGAAAVVDLSASQVGTKRTLSEAQQKDSPPEDIEIIGLTKEEEKRLEPYEEFRELRERFPKKKGRQPNEFYRIAGLIKRKYP